MFKANHPSTIINNPYYFLYHARKFLGFTFIELIIAMILGLLLTELIFSIYITNQKNDLLQQALNDIQDNANNSISQLNSALHHAGNIGCGHLSENFPIVSYRDYSVSMSNKITGNDNALTIRFMDYSTVLLKSPMQDHSTLYTSNETPFTPGDILIISNCNQAEIFQLASISSSATQQKLISQQPLHYLYQPYAEIGRLIINKYYIDKTNRRNPDGSSIYALYTENIFHQKSELVEGIHHMQVTYSLIENNYSIDFHARDIIDWSMVAGVNIDLTLLSPPLIKHWYTTVILHNE
ncbi:MAG: hypothetical protein A3F11_02460 [Gammaproteobacteria bacterium RIFCSPHIGHO2_12_FULL_37_14]|nr:MAG: hypothetical protein A3F11_02460 [Gammaproteobacteria bacterium RIFCSPHIGHO2_12_FULL_37_14]